MVILVTTIRADLAGLPAYVPGRTIPGAIKLASNEVPHPPTAPVLAAIAEAAAAGNRYPDLATVGLTARIAQALGVGPERIATGCGSVSICQQLVQATCLHPEDEVVFAWRSFEAYPIVTQIGGATARTVPLTDDFRHDLDAMAAAVGPRTRLVMVCSPNNPTGTVVTRAELAAFLTAVGPDVVVAFDEAYREYVTDPDAADGLSLIDAHPNLVVLRTFSKAYRLAALRVGYAVASPEVATALRKVCAPFSVSSVAQAGAIAALDHADELLAACAEVVTERVRVRDALLAAGFTVPPTQANFVWLALGDRTADFAAHCLDHKVVVRPFHPDGVRVTVSTPAENDAFLDAAITFPR
ncbi:histidinol-phosphate transaminase [Pseudonocardia abyssalis]|jgi:histidinol-phosphate aminotransferase|uniref:Aromatic amino acid aminotransferase n=1 Tax=Pseudonocardia abyssalis TaxID=2792008 RepID=A0ABS6UXR0_9PSEU|nr:histidinol-phosphate transaminase [Pseudonocardia abyssalis]MBW0116657.1 histidinol-phosphate transaminase [Pseudonocardia abyssalis]MBW0137063.1 histidinol-phosphate transaminase [Pseudonocardia abyssalis]